METRSDFPEREIYRRYQESGRVGCFLSLYQKTGVYQMRSECLCIQLSYSCLQSYEHPFELGCRSGLGQQSCVPGLFYSSISLVLGLFLSTNEYIELDFIHPYGIHIYCQSLSLKSRGRNTVQSLTERSFQLSAVGRCS